MWHFALFIQTIISLFHFLVSCSRRKSFYSWLSIGLIPVLPMWRSVYHLFMAMWWWSGLPVTCRGWEWLRVHLPISNTPSLLGVRKPDTLAQCDILIFEPYHSTGLCMDNHHLCDGFVDCEFEYWCVLLRLSNYSGPNGEDELNCHRNTWTDKRGAKVLPVDELGLRSRAAHDHEGNYRLSLSLSRT